MLIGLCEEFVIIMVMGGVCASTASVLFSRDLIYLQPIWDSVLGGVVWSVCEIWGYRATARRAYFKLVWNWTLAAAGKL